MPRPDGHHARASDAAVGGGSGGAEQASGPAEAMNGATAIGAGSVATPASRQESADTRG
jgi:hypothetical protein